MTKTETTRDLIDAGSISLATKHVTENRTTGLSYDFLSTLMRNPDGGHIIVDDGTVFDTNADEETPKKKPYSEVRQVSDEHAAELLASGEWALTGGSDRGG
jgi:hypothetical protein